MLSMYSTGAPCGVFPKEAVESVDKIGDLVLSDVQYGDQPKEKTRA